MCSTSGLSLLFRQPSTYVFYLKPHLATIFISKLLNNTLCEILHSAIGLTRGNPLGVVLISIIMSDFTNKLEHLKFAIHYIGAHERVRPPLDQKQII